MIFYLCNGNELAGTQADAKKLDRDYVQHDVPTDKSGLMAYINKLMNETREDALGIGDDYSAGQPAEKGDDTPPADARESYTHQSIALDDAWEGLPLARKLHFAALAMEEAREKVNG